MTPGEFAMHKVPQWKRKHVFVAVAMALVVWLLDVSGTVPDIDDWGYDTCLRIRAATSKTPAHVLLVYVDREHLTGSSDVPESMAHKLLDLGARKVGFLCSLPDPSEGLVTLAQTTEDIVLSREFHPDPLDPTQLELSPVATATRQLPLGLAGVFPTSRGVYRSHFGGLPVESTWHPSLEAVLARQVLLDGETLPVGEYRVAFRGGTGSLPHVDAATVMGGNLVRKFVAGKVVLVGLQPDPAFPGIPTPTAQGHLKMSLLEFHGHALQTLLVTRPIRVLPPLGRLVLSVISALICYLLFQSTRLKWGLPLLVIAVLLQGLVALASLIWLSFWIPCAPLAVVQILCFVAVCHKKTRLCEHSVGGMLLDRSIQLRRRRIPTGFYSTHEPWSQLTSLVSQQFHLTRLIVLERPPKSDYLREVHAVNCSLEAIEERRRDCQRWPYSAAFESKLPLRMDTGGYSYFKGQEPGEHQYLVQLAHNGEVMGFLVLGVSDVYLQACSDFRLRVQSAADELAALLHRWRWVQSQRVAQRSWRGKWVGFPEEEPFRQLERANHLLENRLARLEKTFDVSSSGCAIYDLFGQLLMMNSRLSLLLRDKGIVPSETSAVDLLSLLTGRGVNACRTLLQQTVGDKRTTSMQIALDDDSRVFELHVRPLQLDSVPAMALPEEADPFQLHGIQIEMIDGTPFVEMHDAKDRITDRLYHDLSNNLDDMHQLLAQLAHEVELPEDYQRVSETVEQNLLQAVTALQECHGFVNSDLIHQAGVGVPIDAAAALRRAVRASEQAADRDWDVRLLLPDVVGDVLAHPQFIQPVFATLLELLGCGVPQPPVITVRVEERVGDTSFVLETAEFKATADDLRKVLVNGEETSVESFRKLREVRDWVDQWGGRLVVATRDDQSVAIKLVLKRHHWLSDPRPFDAEPTKETGTQK